MLTSASQVLLALSPPSPCPSHQLFPTSSHKLSIVPWSLCTGFSLLGCSPRCIIRQIYVGSSAFLQCQISTRSLLTPSLKMPPFLTPCNPLPNPFTLLYFFKAQITFQHSIGFLNSVSCLSLQMRDFYLCSLKCHLNRHSSAQCVSAE